MEGTEKSFPPPPYQFNEWNGPTKRHDSGSIRNNNDDNDLRQEQVTSRWMTDGRFGWGIEVSLPLSGLDRMRGGQAVRTEQKERTISSDPHLWQTHYPSTNDTKFCAYTSHLLSFLSPPPISASLLLSVCYLWSLAVRNRLPADRYGHSADEYQLNLWRPFGAPLSLSLGRRHCHCRLTCRRGRRVSAHEES